MVLDRIFFIGSLVKIKVYKYLIAGGCYYYLWLLLIIIIVILVSFVIKFIGIWNIFVGVEGYFRCSIVWKRF